MTDKKEKLIPNKLIPPDEARQRIIANDKRRMPKSKIKRFIKIFFLGEGY